MKYTCETQINLPVSIVVELWKDENYFKEWQDGFVKIEHIKGEPETVGAISKIYLTQNNRKMELLETITVINLPFEKSAIYEHRHMTNTLTTRFIATENNKTRYVAEVEYLNFNGIIPKLMAKLFPGMFKKQNQKWMEQFKQFAEKRMVKT